MADAHNLLSYGGIFGYPGTSQNPRGKLRLLYEANPLALVLEEAGGMASNGRGRILDMQVLVPLHVYMAVYLSASLSVYLPFCLSFCVSYCMRVCLSVYLSVLRYVCMSVCFLVCV